MKKLFLSLVGVVLVLSMHFSSKATIASIGFFKKDGKYILLIGDRTFAFNKRPEEASVLNDYGQLRKYPTNREHLPYGYYDASDRFLLEGFLNSLTNKDGIAFLYLEIEATFFKTLINKNSSSNNTMYKGLSSSLSTLSKKYKNINWLLSDITNSYVLNAGSWWNAFEEVMSRLLKSYNLSLDTADEFWEKNPAAQSKFFIEKFKKFKFAFKKAIKELLSAPLPSLDSYGDYIQTVLDSLKKNKKLYLNQANYYRYYRSTIKKNYQELKKLLFCFKDSTHLSSMDTFLEIFEHTQSLTTLKQFGRILNPLGTVLDEAQVMTEFLLTLERHTFVIDFISEDQYDTCTKDILQLGYTKVYSLTTQHKRDSDLTLSTLDQILFYGPHVCLLDERLLKSCFEKCQVALLTNNTQDMCNPKENKAVEDMLVCCTCKERISEQKYPVQDGQTLVQACSINCVKEKEAAHQNARIYGQLQELLESITDKEYLEALYRIVFYHAILLNPLLVNTKNIFLECISLRAHTTLKKALLLVHTSTSQALIGNQIITLLAINTKSLRHTIAAIAESKKNNLAHALYHAQTVEYDKIDQSSYKLADSLRENIKQLQKSYLNTTGKSVDIHYLYYIQTYLTTITDLLGYTPSVLDTVTLINNTQETREPKKQLGKEEAEDTFDEQAPIEEEQLFQKLVDTTQLSILDNSATKVLRDINKKSREKKPLVSLRDTFGPIFYRIDIFNLRTTLAQDPYLIKKLNTSLEYHPRITLLTTLYSLWNDSQYQPKLTISKNNYGIYQMYFNKLAIKESIAPNTNVHHLFSFNVDRYLVSHGILEYVDDNSTIQVSVPGALTFSDGSCKIGFFQYGFNKQLTLCYHRCFKEYTAKSYISAPLRAALVEFLHKHTAELPSYILSALNNYTKSN
ncbi:hypothetical protein H0X48_02415 [Candidatus Dependentiae bacterium]|nr:hypothetical protein [Candidatus Dependentiae bacterium]